VKSVYVLIKIDYRDDDKHYHASSSNIGCPIKIFSSKKKAEEIALQKNLFEFEELIRNSEIKRYAYSFEEIVSSKTLEDELLFEESIFMTIFGEDAYQWWKTLNQLKYYEKSILKIEPTPEQWKKLYDCFTLRFWSVVEVEKG
jgi:hypothetical protein